MKPDSRDSYAEAVSLFEHALSLDPQSVEAQTSLAGSLASRVLTGLTASATVDLARADELIGRALAAWPRYALAHHVKGQVLRAQNRWEEAIPEYETALASNPNFVAALNGLGWCKLFAGRAAGCLDAPSRTKTRAQAERGTPKRAKTREMI